MATATKKKTQAKKPTPLTKAQKDWLRQELKKRPDGKGITKDFKSKFRRFLPNFVVWRMKQELGIPTAKRKYTRSGKNGAATKELFQTILKLDKRVGQLEGKLQDSEETNAGLEKENAKLRKGLNIPRSVRKVVRKVARS